MPTLEDYYRNTYQYGLEDYNTAGPEGDRQAVSYAPGYIEELLALRNKVESGQGSDWAREWFRQQAQAAMAIPLRDVNTLTYNAGEEAPDRVSGGMMILATEGTTATLRNIMLSKVGRWGLREAIREGNGTLTHGSLSAIASLVAREAAPDAPAPQQTP